MVSGENWYEAPSWKKHHFRDIDYTENYIDDLSTVPLDVDEDGHVDLVTIGWFSKKISWWRNPGGEGMWQEHVIDRVPIELLCWWTWTTTAKRMRCCRSSAMRPIR